MRSVDFIDGFESVSPPSITVELVDDAVKGTMILLDNNEPLRSKDNATTGIVNIVKVNTSDIVELLSRTQLSVAPSSANDLVNKEYSDTSSIINAIIFG
jgi:hypothetical protein